MLSAFCPIPQICRTQSMLPKCWCVFTFSLFPWRGTNWKGCIFLLSHCTSILEFGGMNISMVLDTYCFSKGLYQFIIITDRCEWFHLLVVFLTCICDFCFLVLGFFQILVFYFLRCLLAFVSCICELYFYK